VSVAASLGPLAAAFAAVTVGIAVRPTTSSTPRRPDGPNSPSLRNTVRQRLARPVVALVAVVLGSLLAVTFGVAAMIATTSAVFGLRRLRPIRDARRRRVEIETALPGAMDMLVLNVRAGRTPLQAVGDLSVALGGAVGEAFAEVVRRTERGQSFADALRALPDRLGPRAGSLSDVIATSDRHGLPLGPVLDQLTIEVRDARRRLEQANARRLPVRLSFPLVLCTLPSFVLLAILPAVIAALSTLGTTTSW
jgi:tight adherence protein C